MAVRRTSATVRLRNEQVGRQFLDTTHPIYRANKERWELNEARFAGGDDVLDELEAFDWETDPNGHIATRKSQAVYINFPEMYCSAVAGHLLKVAPKPGQTLDFGKLGQVGKTKKTSSRADMVYQNPDGPGNTGSGWDLWWADTAKLAIVTGHRWIFVEAPGEAPLTQARELAGLRPYLCEYSPLDVPNWLYSTVGELQFAIIRFWEWNPNNLWNSLYDAETFQGFSYLLLVREGYTGFDADGEGERYSGGGWWKFTPDKQLYDNGDWADTMGQIPLFPLFYERSKGTRKRPAMSRSGTTELGQAAVAAMNIGSAANFNAVDTGSGLVWLMGVDEDSQDLALGQIKRGDRYIGVPPNQDTEVTPTVTSTGVGRQNTATVFDTREKAIWAAAVQLGISEATGPSQAPSAQDGPGNTGASQQVKFSNTQGPRIAKLAANLELAQQIAIDFLHLRFGEGQSTGNVQWPKKFDVMDVVDRIKQFFEIQRLAGVSSQTMDAQAMVQVAEEKGLISDPSQKQQVLDELKKSAKVKQQTAQTQAASKMAPPQAPSTANKQKARMAGRKQDRKQGPGRNVGGAKP